MINISKFIYCEEKDKNKLLKEGLKYICNQELGNKEYCVFDYKEIKTLNFDNGNLIISDKMFF